jgi:hypothetical protein
MQYLNIVHLYTFYEKLFNVLKIYSNIKKKKYSELYNCNTWKFWMNKETTEINRKMLA